MEQAKTCLGKISMTPACVPSLDVPNNLKKGGTQKKKKKTSKSCQMLMNAE